MKRMMVKARIETFPIRGVFAISRETRTEQTVVSVTISDGHFIGQAECVPYKRYGETPDGVVSDIIKWDEQAFDRAHLLGNIKAGAARNGLDCALWDLEAKSSNKPVWQLAGLLEPCAVETCFTLSLANAESMHQAARQHAARPWLKVKLCGDGDPERIRAVRAGAPNARLVVDANEAWRPDIFATCMSACQEARVEMIEQPLPSEDDGYLETIPRPIPICADESLHDRADLPRLLKRYDAVNIKLDKAGGLTEALLLANAASSMGLRIMVGCMLATSLAMAPALLLAQMADVVDLDGPLLLEKDRSPGLVYRGSMIEPSSADLWG